MKIVAMCNCTFRNALNRELTVPIKWFMCRVLKKEKQKAYSINLFKKAMYVKMNKKQAHEKNCFLFSYTY
jgi:hypothetical protein